MFCPKCGKDNYEQVRHCKGCGLDLGQVHLAVDGRLPDLTTVMTEEKRRRMIHRGLISAIAGGGFIVVFLVTLLMLLSFSGSSVLSAVTLLPLFFIALLGVPLLAYGLSGLISGRFVYGRQAPDYAQRFNVVRDMLASQPTEVLPPAGFPSSVTEPINRELTEPARRPPERERN